MMTPDRFHLLRECFFNAQIKGMHGEMTPPVQSFASELVDLLLNNYHHLNKKGSDVSKTVRESCSRILPKHISSALHKWAGAFKDKGSALDFVPNAPRIGAADKGTEFLEPT